ncbi:hypothetical protein MBRU_13120 [Mycolicibacterium brumae DSM 44177]|nr:hypothetical protein MBRU_13120 [Mycolicibacterium brumae DSM 44177]
MEAVAWDVMYKSSHTPDATTRADRRATVRRIVAFAAPHRRRIVVFVAASTLTAALTVVTPLLAGKVVNPR